MVANFGTKFVVAQHTSADDERGQCDRNRSYATRESSTNNVI